MNQFEITLAEKQSLDDNGYFVQPKAYSVNLMREMGDHINWLIGEIEASPHLTENQRRTILNRNAQAEAKTGPASLVSLFRLSLFSRRMRQYMQDGRKLTVARSLLGDDLFCPNDLYFLKPPGTGKAVAWHQDSWYFNNVYRPADGGVVEGITLGTWLAIDDAHVDNGCLWIIPGTHKQGVINHHDDANRTNQFLGNKVPKLSPELEAQAIPIEVPRGSLVYFNNAVLHRSTPNHSPQYRRAYVVHYMKGNTQHQPGAYANMASRIAEWGWGTMETYLSGRVYPDGVQTTPEAERLNWDEGIG